MNKQSIIGFGAAFLSGACLAGSLAWFISRDMVWDARFEERERDLKTIFASFEACKGNTDCEEKYRYAWFDLKTDQALRDGQDVLERNYKKYPYLRPEENSQPRIPSALQ